MDDDIPAEFWQAIDQFNQQEFYDCHDILENLWMEAAEPQRTFYQGILQIAVALYHLGNQNHRGAVILLGEGSRRLWHYRPSYFELDITQLVEDSGTLLTLLQELAVSQPDSGSNNSEFKLAESIPRIQRSATIQPID